MSHKNYHRMYNKSESTDKKYHKEEILVDDSAEMSDINATKPETESEQMPDIKIGESISEPTTEKPAEPETLYATVINCNKLNVRETPDPSAAVLAVLEVGSEVIVDPVWPKGNYYKICTASGLEGYCVKDYLKIK